MFSNSIFRANDIRGVYNRDFDLEFCGPLSRALSALLHTAVLKPKTFSGKTNRKTSDQKNETQTAPRPRVLVGRDCRLSSPELAAELTLSLRKAGAHTIFAGLAPSPLCYFLLYHYRFSATVVVTASHNPKNYNGFKIMVHSNLNIPDPVSALKKTLQQTNKTGIKTKPLRREGFSFQKPDSSIDIFTPYIDSLKKEFSLKPLPFVVDAGNGAGGPLAKRVFKALGLSPFYLFCEPDGRFPNHHPDPTVEKNLFALKKKVFETKSLFGVGWDGDGDRVGVVTGKGRFVSGDELGFLFLPSLLKKSAEAPSRRAGEKESGEFSSAGDGSFSSDEEKSLKSDGHHQPNSRKIIADVKCSNRFFQAVRDQGGEVILSKSGHRFTRRALEIHQAVFALEFSGHIFFNDRPLRGFDDALYATLRLIELLTETPDMEALLPPVNLFKTNEIRLALSPREIAFALKRVKNYLQSRGEAFNSLDGARITRGNSWALFRDSKTQNILSMRFEADSKKELDLLLKEFSQVMKIPISEIVGPEKVLSI